MGWEATWKRPDSSGKFNIMFVKISAKTQVGKPEKIALVNPLQELVCERNHSNKLSEF